MACVARRAFWLGKPMCPMGAKKEWLRHGRDFADPPAIALGLGPITGPIGNHWPNHTCAGVRAGQPWPWPTFVPTAEGFSTISFITCGLVWNQTLNFTSVLTTLTTLCPRPRLTFSRSSNEGWQPALRSWTRCSMVFLKQASYTRSSWLTQCLRGF